LLADLKKKGLRMTTNTLKWLHWEFWMESLETHPIRAMMEIQWRNVMCCGSILSCFQSNSQGFKHVMKRENERNGNKLRTKNW